MLANIAIIPAIPVTPKPGITKISKASNIIPSTNTAGEINPLSPIRNCAVKNKKKHTIATTPPTPKPGVFISKYIPAIAIDINMLNTAGLLKNLKIKSY